MTEYFEFLDELYARLEAPVTVRDWMIISDELVKEYPHLTSSQAISAIERFMDELDEIAKYADPA